MKVNLRGVHLTLTEALKQHVQSHLVGPIQRIYDSEAAELEIHLRDTNGPKGGRDKECSVTVRYPNGHHSIHVTEASEDIYKSIDLARDRVVNSAKRMVERSQDRRHESKPADLHPLE
jgi:putative sigma-54 modulation protein